jgi:DNA-directed RNA polymerase subunit K/omega
VQNKKLIDKYIKFKYTIYQPTSKDVMNIKNSRGSAVDIEKCIELAGGNQFNLVLALADRAREIARQDRADNKQEFVDPIVTALLELQNGEFIVPTVKK